MSDIENPHQRGDVTLETKDEDAIPEPERGRSGRLDDFASSVKGFAQRLPDSIGRAIESAQTALAQRANAITIHVDDEAQARIDQLVEAGVFKNRSESAAYLIGEGIRARSDIFNAIGARIAEIERLRSEMRAIVAEPNEPLDDSQ